MKPGSGKTSRVALAGLGGFLLGAATVLLIVWLYGGGSFGPAVPPAATPPAAPPQAAPSPAPPVPPPAASPSVPLGSSVSPFPGEAEADLARRGLLVPVHGVRPEELRDTFSEARGSERHHEAMDILAPRNTPVEAVEDGSVAKLFTSQQGGLTVYQFDPTGSYVYYYAHLERYAEGLREGGALRRGQVIGYVGTSGNAPKDTPHLHFAIFQLGPERHWWEGTPLNPFPILRGQLP